MDRFATAQLFDRTHGPIVGAPSDGITQGTPYTAVIQSAISGGLVEVTIPALHLSYTRKAFIQPGTPCKVGESCIVVFDDQKLPWVISGVWAGGPVRGTELPASPTDGQEYDYVADATGGVIWRLRYRAASTSTHKWEFVGGSDSTAFASGGENTLVENSKYQAAAGTPTVTVPLAGDYYVTVSCLYAQYNSAVAATGLNLAVGKTTGEIYFGSIAPISQFGLQEVYQRLAVANLVASTALKLWVEGEAAKKWTLNDLTLGLCPRRVG